MRPGSRGRPVRRLIVEEPVSRPAIWSPRVAWFALAVTAIAVAFIRFQIVDVASGFASLAAGLGLAILAVALSFLAFVRIWTEGRRGLGLALKGILIAALVLGWPGWYAVRAITLPVLADVSTDLEDPPAFSRSRAALEARAGRVPPELAASQRAAQAAAYPQVSPLRLEVTAEQAFDLARRAAQARGWQIVEAAPPGGRIGLGRIDAVDRTFLLRLPDDVTVRIRPLADGARIDVRSASRVGRHDFGQNARRIRRYLDEVSTLAASGK